MNRPTFFKDKDVADFVGWLVQLAPEIKVTLNIANSKFVPGGIRQNCVGLQSVVDAYKWRSVPSVGCDWESTKGLLENLRNRLQTAIRVRSESEAYETCVKILAWGGGNRLSGKGASKFLETKYKARTLVAYLNECGSVLRLESAALDNLNSIEKMNSMLTKVHALVANDGLPIYDSRVAVAIASLVEMYRRDMKLSALPHMLSFPAVPAASKPERRKVRHLFSDASDPGTLSYNAADQWSWAKVRLGWIMQAVLEGCNGVFRVEKDLPSRMHAFEASLFMIGYDVTCLRKMDATQVVAVV